MLSRRPARAHFVKLETLTEVLLISLISLSSLQAEQPRALGAAAQSRLAVPLRVELSTTATEYQRLREI